jgi:hypothetical protein
MATISGMTRERATALLDLVAEESKKEKSRFVGLQLSERPFTPEDVAQGREMFLGRVELLNGGAPCLSCHTVEGLGGLGGGRLGPDLTKVFERYEDRKKLGAWLSAPATPTMLPTFRDRALTGEEILPLVAFFQDAAARAEADVGPAALVFVLLGVGGAVGVLLAMNYVWRGRFRAVRAPRVAPARARSIGPSPPSAVPHS